MRTIAVLNRVSIDGFFAGPNGEMDWFIPDAEVDRAWHEGRQADTLLCGRVTYQLFEGHWPKVGADPNAPKEARIIADEMDQLTKVVFSRTLKEVTWKNTRLVHDDVVGEARKLKQGPGAGIMIFGSGTIVQQLADQALIDEYLLTVTPVILGSGKPLFKDVSKLNLELSEARGFKSGNVLLHYTSRAGR
jgi:dihydrofolate reductase